MIKNRRFLYDYNKRGQISIFIIIGIIIVAMVILFFILRGALNLTGIGREEINPSSFLSSCLEEEVKENLAKITLQGGDINPKIYKQYRFEGEETKNISYLCYTPNYYVTCVNQKPMLFQNLKNELKNSLSEKVNQCFESFISSLKKEGYSVESRHNGFDINLAEKRISINFDSEIKLEKTDETLTQKDFETEFSTRFYELANVVQEIVNQEAEYCNFDPLGYMILYPQWKISKTKASDSTIIYTVQRENSEEKFRFAIRGCVIRPGI